MTITVETIFITPSIASAFLAANVDNRPLRRSVVESWKGIFQRGEYTQTHQGIAFSASGFLADGQHRLTAISELRDGSFPMLVTRGIPDPAFKNMDGGVKRTAADALREDKRVVEVARLLAAMAFSHGSKSSPTPAQLLPFIEDIQSDHTDLMEAYASPVRTWTAAPVRAAAIISVKRGADMDYVKSIYRLMATRNLDDMPPIARALYKSEASGTVRAGASVDMLSRCLSVFDRKKATNKVIHSKPTSATVAIVRDTFKHLLTEQTSLEYQGEKKAAPISAAKGISRPNYLTAAR